MRMAAVILLAVSSGCCSEQVSITDDWTGYLVPVMVDVGVMRGRVVHPSYVAFICREYIDQCWEWNMDLSFSHRSKPEVICKVSDDLVLYSRNAKNCDLQNVPIPCGGIIEVKETSLRDAIVKVCDNYGLVCSFGEYSVVISIDN
jgi:hypothetical protein